MIDLLIRRLEKEGHEKEEFDCIKGLVMSPTRELAIQIKDHLEAVVPPEYSQQIKIAALVGGMSIQKQIRLLSYKPTIIVATPGRLWELMSEQMDTYLLKSLPMIDVLVLDEADRMIADGHFKEMNHILAHVYTNRVSIKNDRKKKQSNKEEEKKPNKFAAAEMQEITADSKEFKTKGNDIDFSKVKDLYDDDQLLEEMDAEDNLVIEDPIGSDDEDQPKKKKGRKQSKEVIDKLQDETFTKEYLKVGGIQHIICSATLTIDKRGRITPRQQKLLKKKQLKEQVKGFKGKKKFKKNFQQDDDEKQQGALDDLCKILKFRSKHPKVIDLTEEARIPDTLTEKVVRCKKEEKDLFMYYYLTQKQGESIIIFSNSITCTKRCSSILSFLKIKNYCLHSKMQQRQRLKVLDRFKRDVQTIEDEPVELGTQSEKKKAPETAVLVCTDVAARGLDIPNVGNVLHY